MSSQLHILCTNAVKRYYANSNNLFMAFTFHLFSYEWEFMEAKKTLPRSIVQTSFWFISYSTDFSNKNCIVEISQTLII